MWVTCWISTAILVLSVGIQLVLILTGEKYSILKDENVGDVLEPRYPLLSLPCLWGSSQC